MFIPRKKMFHTDDFNKHFLDNIMLYELLGIELDYFYCIYFQLYDDIDKF